jgi:alkaline phosphatase D
MRAMKRLVCLVVVALSLTACDDAPAEPDAGPAVDAYFPPRQDAGPFVCPNPAWTPGTPPVGMAPSIDELVVDRDAADGATATVFDPDAVPEGTALFDLGVQAGAMTPDGARLWTHASMTVPLTLRVWREGGDPGEVLLAVEQAETPADGGFVHATVTGLAPATRYSYAFFAGTAPTFTGRSAIGRFTTAIPAGELARVRVAATTCTNQSTRPFEALTLMAAEDPDVFLQLGDMTYNDGDATIEEFRATWAENLGDPGYRAILSRAGGYFTWDDHEVVDSGDYYDAPAAVRMAGERAFYENVPAEPVDRGGRPTLWNGYAWGDSIDFIVMDSRSERDPASRLTAGARYVSEEQLAYVQDRLMTSTARFKVVLNSVPITNLPIPPWATEEDRWQGYPAQRDRLISFIVDNAIEGVWFLTGDFHLGFVTRVEVDGGGRDIWEVAVGPGGSAGGNPIPALARDGFIDVETAFPCAMFAYYSEETNATTTLDFDPVAGTVHIRFVEAETEAVLFDETIWHIE